MLRRTGIAIIAAGLLAAPLGYTATAGAQQSAETGQSMQAAAQPKVKACAVWAHSVLDVSRHLALHLHEVRDKDKHKVNNQHDHNNRD